MLRIQLKNSDQPPIWIAEKTFTIGSADQNHLVLPDSPYISSTHLKLITREDKLFLKDNNSESGSFVNNKRVTQIELMPGDEIQLGNTEILVLAAQANNTHDDQQPATWALVGDGSWLAGQEFKIETNPAIIGRGTVCDITLSGTHLSRQHAELHIKGNRLHIRDLASANGTFINDQRINEAVVKPGDQVRFDVYSFRVIGPTEDHHKTRVRTKLPNGYQAVKAKPVNENPKQWKTRPTSPGNRIEQAKYERNLNFWILLVTLLISAGLLGYLFWL